MVFNSNNEKETLEIAKTIARSFKGGDIISLIGDLGAGKTVFTKGIGLALGVGSVIKSPTFTLMNVYEAKNSQGIEMICHIDAYRLKSSKDLLAIGAEEYFENGCVLTIIEWGDKAKDILPKNAKIINITALTENKRKICLN